MNDDRRRGVRRIVISRNLDSVAAVNHAMPVSCHYHGRVVASRKQAIRKIALEFRQFYWYGGFLRYSAKHFRHVLRKVFSLAVLVGSRGLNPIAGISKVVRLAVASTV